MGTDFEVLLGDEDGEGMKGNGRKWLDRWDRLQWIEEVGVGMSGMEEDWKGMVVYSECGVL